MTDQNKTDPNQPLNSDQPLDQNSASVPDFLVADSTQTPPISTPTPSDTTTQQSNPQPIPEPVQPSTQDSTEVTTLKPVKKFGGGKIIATILGFLVLVGGIAGGVILTQQDQNISEKAATTSCKLCLQNAEDADECYPNPCGGGNDSGGPVQGPPGQKPKDDDDGDSDDDGYKDNCVPNCANKNCGNNGCGGSCGTCTGGEICGGGGAGRCGIASTTGCTTTDAINGYCSPGPGAGTGCVGKALDFCGSGKLCHCQGGQPCNFGVCVSTTSFQTACEGDGRVVSKNSENQSAYTCCEAGYVAGPNGIGCVPGGSKNTPPPGGNTPPPVTAQCLNVKAFNTNFVQLTPTQLSQLRAGDRVRFTVAGQASSGAFQKARFTINGTLRSEVTGKRPGTEEFFDEFIIPAGVTSFTISAQIFHSTLGWK